MRLKHTAKLLAVVGAVAGVKYNILQLICKGAFEAFIGIVFYHVFDFPLVEPKSLGGEYPVTSYLPVKFGSGRSCLENFSSIFSAAVTRASPTRSPCSRDSSEKYPKSKGSVLIGLLICKSSVKSILKPSLRCRVKRTANTIFLSRHPLRCCGQSVPWHRSSLPFRCRENGMA